MTWELIRLAFVGMGHLIADYSIAVVVAAALIVGSFFIGAIPVVGVLLGKFRIDMLWAGGLIIACLLWGAKIEHDTNLHWQAKAAMVDTGIATATKKSVEKPSAPSRWETKE